MWGEYQDFRSKIVRLTVPKTSGGESFLFQYSQVLKKFMLQKVMAQFFPIFLSYSVKQNPRGTLPGCVSENFR